MKTFIIAAAAAVTLAGPVLANDQLSLQLGVEPGTLSTHELIVLRAADEAGDRTLADFYRNGGSEIVSTQSIGNNAGKAQFAAQLGVDPSAYSVAELIQLRVANEDEGIAD